jgi:hypothetical protein
MTATKVIRYRTKPECADDNQRLIGDLFAELRERNPDGLQYMSLRLDDGVTFVHIAVVDGEENPLSTSPAFGAFQEGIKDRCAEGPSASDAAVVGSYRFQPE